MSQPMIVWCAIMGVLLVAFVFRAFEKYYIMCHHKTIKSHHLVEIGKEREMFYVPGDAGDDDFD